MRLIGTIPSRIHGIKGGEITVNRFLFSGIKNGIFHWVSRVFIVYGVGHAVVQEPALRALLG